MSATSLRVWLAFLAGVLAVANGSNAHCEFDPRYNIETPVKRVALVIGNATYEHAEKLPGSISDATIVANKLRAANFDVTEGEDVKTREEFLNKYFLPFLDQIEEGSFVVVYYSGHGFTYGGEGYLAPLSFPERVPRSQVFATFISVTALKERINNMHPGLLLMLLDACRSIGGFIDPSEGGPPDVDKGLPAMDLPENDILSFSSEPGHISKARNDGGLSYYTEALANFLNVPDLEFDAIKKRVVQKVREATANSQSPWTSDSSTLEVYFSASPSLLGVFKGAWEAAQQADSVQAVKDFLASFGLTSYAASARKWLSEKKQASTFTQFSTAEIDQTWATALSQAIQVARIAGPFGFERAAAAQPDSIPRPAEGKSPGIQKNPLLVANLLRKSQDTIVLEPSVGRKSADANSMVLTSLDVGTKIAVDSVERDPNGNVWLKASKEDTPNSFYVRVPQTAGTKVESLGQAINESDLRAEPNGSSALADPRQIAQILENLRKRGARINWISIATPSSNHGQLLSARDDAKLGMRAYHAAYLFSKTVPKGRITVIENADFDGSNPRVRIFGTAKR